MGIYPNDPRSVLIHYNKNHDPNNGQFSEGHGGFSNKSDSAKRSEKSNAPDNTTKEIGTGIHLSESQRKALKIGAIAAIAAIAIIGGIALSKSGKLDKAIESGQKIVERETVTVDKLKTVANGINPTFSDIEGIPKSNLDGAPLNKVNCQCCTLAYELRRRFGNEAVKSAKLVDCRQKGNIFETIYKDVNTDFAKNSDLSDTLKTLGDGARGNIIINSKTLGGFHSIAFEVINGTAMAFDCQSGASFDLAGDTLGQLYDVDEWSFFSRLDNLDLAGNAQELIDQFVNR